MGVSNRRLKGSSRVMKSVKKGELEILSEVLAMVSSSVALVSSVSSSILAPLDNPAYVSPLKRASPWLLRTHFCLYLYAEMAAKVSGTKYAVVADLQLA